MVQLDHVTQSRPHLGEYRDLTSAGDLIGLSTLPSRFIEKYTQPACGIKRTVLNLALKEALVDAGIELHEGWKLKEIQENETGVTAISEDGDRIEGSLLIGCDGIKSVSRGLLNKQHGLDPEEAVYTGLIQVSTV